MIRHKKEKENKPSIKKEPLSAEETSEIETITLDSSDNEDRKSKTKSRRFKRTWPTAGSSPSSQTRWGTQLLENDDKPVKKGSSKVSESSTETSDGTITIKKYGRPKHQKIKKNLKCPVQSYDHVCDFIVEQNSHLKEQHPDFHFRCAHCPKQYATYNAKYKYEHKHFELPYVCHFCDKRFLFPALHQKHENQHTGKGLIPCTWPKCKVQLSCNDAFKQHIVTHTDQCFNCTECDKDFNTDSILKQHLKGALGDRFISLCCSSFDWSDKRNNHQEKCKECLLFKYEKSHLPKNPNKHKQLAKSLNSDKALPFIGLTSKEPEEPPQEYHWCEFHLVF